MADHGENHLTSFLGLTWNPGSGILSGRAEIYAVFSQHRWLPIGILAIEIVVAPAGHHVLVVHFAPVLMSSVVNEPLTHLERVDPFSHSSILF